MNNPPLEDNGARERLERDFDYLLHNLKNAVRHKVEGTAIKWYADELEKCEKECVDFISEATTAAYLSGRREALEEAVRYGFLTQEQVMSLVARINQEMVRTER